MSDFTILPAMLRFIVRVTPSVENGRGQDIICFADNYDIKPDGSLTFWGRLKVGKEGAHKIINVPTLSYASGKWDGVTLSWGNEMPAFVRSVAGNNDESTLTSNVNLSSVSSSSAQAVRGVSSNLTADSDNGGNGGGNYNAHNSAYNGSYARSASSIPGLDLKQREDWEKERSAAVGKCLNAWFLKNDRFPGSVQFLKQMPELLKGEPFPRMNEDDLDWAVVSLLKKKMYPASKFQNKEMYRFLDFSLPGIIKRHGGSRLSPLLKMLRDLEETKNVSPIDLVVWMINNHQIKY